MAILFFHYPQFIPLGKDFFHPSYLPVDQPNLDTMGMAERSRQDILDNTPGQFPGSLVFFQNDIDRYSRFYIPPISSIHRHLSLNIESRSNPDSMNRVDPFII